ncbi:hypothetical protein D3C77_634410 [compost metagenome]
MKGNDKAGLDEEVKPGSAPRWGIASPQRGSDKKTRQSSGGFVRGLLSFLLGGRYHIQDAYVVDHGRARWDIRCHALLAIGQFRRHHQRHVTVVLQLT